MAFEASEGLYAGLSLIGTTELEEASTNINKFKTVYRQAFNLLKESGKIKDGAGNKTRNGLVAATDIDKSTETATKNLYDEYNRGGNTNRLCFSKIWDNRVK